MNRLLFTAAFLFFLSPGISAENYPPKFEQSVELKEFIRTASDPSLGNW